MKAVSERLFEENRHDYVVEDSGQREGRLAHTAVVTGMRGCTDPSFFIHEPILKASLSLTLFPEPVASSVALNRVWGGAVW